MKECKGHKEMLSLGSSVVIKMLPFVFNTTVSLIFSEKYHSVNSIDMFLHNFFFRLTVNFFPPGNKRFKAKHLSSAS